MGEIQNPILPGFAPDPSILRVGDDFYIATSTFEWYPGVQIHHSKDLKNWQVVSRPLNRPDLLDMRGAQDSCGIWAPCLSWSNGKFYLIYTDVKRYHGHFKDTPNYLTTCETIDGEWSSPVYMNSSGFDPSLFHDDDGRKWFQNTLHDHRHNMNRFGGILLQEYCEETQQLIGPVSNIFLGTELALTEAPHIYKHHGYYYLMVAEGGTSFKHAVTMARSKTITGPYEADPEGYALTAKDNPDLLLKRSGHASMIELENGELYMAHLCSRTLKGLGTNRSPMGRETALQKMCWSDDLWLRLEAGGNQPQESLPMPSSLEELPATTRNEKTYFNTDQLSLSFQWLRTPYPEQLFELNATANGELKLIGRESIGGLYEQSLVARRQQAFCFTATTKMRFSPDHFQQMAGLTCYYNSKKYHYLHVTQHETFGRCLSIISCLADPTGDSNFPMAEQLSDNYISLPNSEHVYLRCEVNYEKLQFSWSIDNNTWNLIPVTLDHSVLSDEAGIGKGTNFTGNFVGMACNDVSGMRKPAFFEYFEYREH